MTLIQKASRFFHWNNNAPGYERFFKWFNSDIIFVKVLFPKITILLFRIHRFLVFTEFHSKDYTSRETVITQLLPRPSRILFCFSRPKFAAWVVSVYILITYVCMLKRT